MNPQSEFMNETFHALAQPITALRANVELGLGRQEEPAHKALEDCLPWIERLMQDLAVLREIADLDEEPPLDSWDGQILLQSSLEEMEPVTQASGIALHLDAEPGDILCHALTFQRAVFLLLDEVIASSGRNRTISISLRRSDDGFLFEIRPGTKPGLRQKLCRKLMQFGGGCAIDFATGNISATFRECSSRKSPATTCTDKTLLTSH